MSKENKSTGTPTWVKPLTLVLMGVIIGIVLSYAMVASGLKKASDKIETKANTENSTDSGAIAENTTSGNDTIDEENDVITTYELPHEEVKGKELEDLQADLKNRIAHVRETNSFVQLQTGVSEYETYVYNNNGECVAETSDGSYSVVFRNDNKVVKYEDASGALAVGQDIDIMTFIENAVMAAGTNDVKMYRYPENTVDDTYEEYRVDLKGEDIVRLCYSPLGEDFADVMMENLKAQDPEWNPHLVIVLYVPTDDKPNFGAVAISVYDNLNKEFTNWDLLGWIELSDWKLDEWWYTYDFSKADSETYIEHMKSLMDELGSLLDKAGVTEKQDATGTTEETTDSETTDNSDENASAAE